jgi:DNA-binding transcriptional regulator YiaG
MTESRAEQLLRELRARRRLPPAAERRRIREAAGVSLRQLAAAVGPSGVSWMAVNRWEQGSQPRNPAHAAAYADLLEQLQHVPREEVTD